MSIQFLIPCSVILFCTNVHSAPWKAQMQRIKMGTVIYFTDYFQTQPPESEPDAEDSERKFISKVMEMEFPDDVPDLRWEPATPPDKSEPNRSEPESQSDPPESEKSFDESEDVQ